MNTDDGCLCTEHNEKTFNINILLFSSLSKKYNHSPFISNNIKILVQRNTFQITSHYQNDTTEHTIQGVG